MSNKLNAFKKLVEKVVGKKAKDVSKISNMKKIHHRLIQIVIVMLARIIQEHT